MVETRRKRIRPAPGALVSKHGGLDAATGLKGRTVLVPSSALAALESIHGPHKCLHGKVKGKDPGHKDCVLVKCREDPRTLFFDARQVQSWIEEQESAMASMDAGISPGHVFQQLVEGRESKRLHCSSADAPCTQLDGVLALPTALAAEHRPPVGPPVKGVTKKAEVADLVGREVEIPGPVFSNFSPGLTFRAYIIGPDTAHASAVVLRMLDDSHSRYYFHASEVRDWLRMTQLTSTAEDDSRDNDQDTLDESLAAKVLAHMSAGGSSRSPSSSPRSTSWQPVPSPLSLCVPQPPAPPLMRAPPSARPLPLQQQLQQQGPTVAAPLRAGGRSVPPTSSKSMLQWGPTELIAQRPSLLPKSLAEQLVRLTSLPNQAEEAAMLIGRVQAQP